MGTRGAYGFRIDGKDKVTYNHFDSYPDGLGVEMVAFVRCTSDDELTEIANSLELVTQDDKPTSEQIQKNMSYLDLDVSKQSVNDWYCLLRNAQGQPGAWKEGLRFMIDSSDFLADSLFCEWAYIINLDDKTLEIYQGFNKGRGEQKGRYAQLCEDRYNDGTRGYKYYGVNLLAAVPLDDVRLSDFDITQYDREEEEAEV